MQAPKLELNFEVDCWSGNQPAFGPGLAEWPQYKTFSTYTLVEQFYDTVPQGNQHGMSRYGLHNDLTRRVLTPQITQSPVAVHAMCVGGQDLEDDPRRGYWCYDEVLLCLLLRRLITIQAGEKGLQLLLDQAGDVGVEVVVVAQNMNNTWRSQLGSEFQSPENISYVKSIVDYGKARGVDLGFYEASGIIRFSKLIFWSACQERTISGRSKSGSPICVQWKRFRRHGSNFRQNLSQEQQHQMPWWFGLLFIVLCDDVF